MPSAARSLVPGSRRDAPGRRSSRGPGRASRRIVGRAPARRRPWPATMGRGTKSEPLAEGRGRRSRRSRPPCGGRDRSGDRSCRGSSSEADSAASASTTKSTGTMLTVPEPSPRRRNTPGEPAAAPSPAARSTGRRTCRSRPSASLPPRRPGGRSCGDAAPHHLHLRLELRLLVVVLEALAHVEVGLAEDAPRPAGNVGGGDVVQTVEALGALQELEDVPRPLHVDPVRRRPPRPRGRTRRRGGRPRAATRGARGRDRPRSPGP